MKLIDLSYYFSKHISDPELLLQNHHPNIEYVNHLPEGCQCTVIKFLDFDGLLRKSKVDYFFFKGDPKKYIILYNAYKIIKKINPDVIVVHGFTHPIQIILLKRFIKGKTKILLQFHADQPSNYIKRYFQKKADGYINKYLFASKSLPSFWLKNDVITNKIELAPAGSSSFKKINKNEARKLLNVVAEDVFLWVGALNKNKDLNTAILGFNQYQKHNTKAILYIIHHSNELLDETKDLISELKLNDSVILSGKVPFEQMNIWYSAADYYLSSSHSESYGFSLVEAMSCGCIPIVTKIPSFVEITGNGQVGYLYNVNDVEELYRSICMASSADKEDQSKKVVTYFDKHLSFKVMAEKIIQASS